MSEETKFELSGNWTLRDATLIAIGTHGEMFHETGLHLRILEGRRVHLYEGETPGQMLEVWAYSLDFYLADCREPDDSAQHECDAAITGVLTDGRQCKILGRGFVGRDNFGQIEGSFETPPRIELVGAEDRLMPMTETD